MLRIFAAMQGYNDKAGFYLIREARAEETDAIRSLIHQCVRTDYSRTQTTAVVSYYLSYHSSKEVLRRILNARTIVLEESDQILATICLQGNYLTALMVSPSSRGKGYGKRMMHSIIQDAKRAGLNELLLDSVPETVDFHKSLGFKGEKERWMLIPGGERLFYYQMRCSSF